MSDPSNAAPEKKETDAAPAEKKQSYTEWAKEGYSKLPSFMPSSGSEPSDDDKKKLYDSLPNQQKEKQTYTEWVKSGYNNKYETWMPWIEDKYLAWFGKDNKASYAAKDTLNKTKISGDPKIDQLQGDVNELIGNQFGKDGMLNPLGNLASKEGINRAERGGKDDSGSYTGAGVTDPLANAAKGGADGVKGGAEGVAGGAKAAGDTATEGVKSLGGMLGGGGGGGGGESGGGGEAAKK
ncbi:MAG: hypothetical protein M1833_004520 [Piccolia ochrophora]|nr:MAG: hypothetical protein M1833_004520 [Piccolia ochrophora]